MHWIALQREAGRSEAAAARLGLGLGIGAGHVSGSERVGKLGSALAGGRGGLTAGFESVHCRFLPLVVLLFWG
jgi:hypothetical protein